MFQMVNDTICDFEILSYKFSVFNILVCFTKVFLTSQPGTCSNENLTKTGENVEN